MAINKEIKYVITAENQTEQGFNQAESSSKQTSETIKKHAKETANAFGKEFKSQASGIGEAFKMLFKPIELFFKVIKDIGGYIAKLVINFTALAIVGRAVGFIFDNLLGKGNKISSFFNSMSGGIQSVIKMWKTYVTTGVISSLKSTVSNSAVYKTANDLGVVLGNAFMRGFSKSGGATTPQGASNFMGAGNRAELNALNNLFTKFGMTGALAMQKVSHASGMAMSWIPQMNKFISTGFKVGDVLLNIGKFLYQNIKLLGALSVATLAAVVSYKQLNQEIQRGSSIGIGAQKLDLTVERYEALDFMLKQTGSSIEEMDMSFSQLTKKAYEAAKGSDAQSYAFNVLGIKAQNVNGSLKDNSTFLTEVLVKLSNMKDASLRNSIALEIFGKQGRNIIPMFEEYGSEFEKVLKKYEQSDGTLGRFVDNSRRVVKTQREISEAWDDAKASLFEGTIKRLGDSLNIIKNSGIGEVLFGIGKIIMWLVNMLVDGFNVVIGSISVLTSSFMTGVYTIAKGTTWLWMQLHKLLNPNGETLKLTEKFYKNISDLADKSANQVIQSVKQTGVSLAQFASLGMWTGSVKKTSTTTSEQTPVVPENKKFDASPYELAIKLLQTQINLIESRISFNQKLTDLYIENITDATKKELAIIENNYYNQKLEADKLLQDKIINQEQYEDFIGQLGVQRVQKEQEINDKITKDKAKALQTQKLQVISYSKALSDTIQQSNTSIIESMKGLEGIDVYGMLQVNAWNAGITDISTNFSETMIQLQDTTLTSAEKMNLVFQSIGNAVTSTFNTIAQVMSMNSQRIMEGYEKQRTAVDDYYNNERERINSSRMNNIRREKTLKALESEREKAQEEITKKIEEQQRKSAKAQLTLQLIQSIGATALGVTQALKLGPVGIPMSYIIGALGAIQVGIIASQLGKFADGGIVGGNSYNGDNTLARVNSGEMILNKQQQANLFNMANGKSGSNQPLNVDLSINIEGNASSETVSMINESRSNSLKELENMLYDLKYNGRLNYIMR